MKGIIEMLGRENEELKNNIHELIPELQNRDKLLKEK